MVEYTCFPELNKKHICKLDKSVALLSVYQETK